MTVLRWILGVLAGLLAAGSLLTFLIFVAADAPESLKRARKLRRLTSAVLMFWFNLEIWRRVLLILIHWH